MITVIVLPGCLDQYLVPQNREEKEKKKKILSILYIWRKRSGLWTAVRNISHTRSAAILAQEHEDPTRKQGREHIFTLSSFSCLSKFHLQTSGWKETAREQQPEWVLHSLQKSCMQEEFASINTVQAGRTGKLQIKCAFISDLLWTDLLSC